MGASESKVAVTSTAASTAASTVSQSTPKPDPSQRPRNDRVGRLIDPRSPSTDIDRTPIQVGGAFSRPLVEVESECAVPSWDPRSPSVGVTRTPVKVTVGSFARRLGMLFLSDTTDMVSSTLPHQPSGVDNLKVEEVLEDGELGSSELLLSPQPTLQHSQTDVPTPPIQSPFVHLGEAQVEVETKAEDADVCVPPIQSPFIHLGEAQVEVETETDFSLLEEPEDGQESHLHKRLSMSLITCHEGVVPVQICDGAVPVDISAEVLQDCPLSPLPQAAAEPHRDSPDHSYALPSIASDPVCPVTPSQLPTPTVAMVAVVSTDVPELPEEKIQRVPVEVVPEVPAVQESPVSSTLLSTGPSPGLTQQQQTQTGVHCLTINTKSPSQLVFKPQWLGKGFGATGVRARVQGRGGKGGSSSSPLSVRVGAMNVSNENRGQSAKQKLRGKALAEGRSPLQILKTNSPKDQPGQMKLKVSTPDRQRLGQLDRRVLTVALDKENR